MKDLPTILLSDEAVAKAATPGPWNYTTCYGVAFIEAKDREAIAHAVEYLTPDNASYIARFSPDYVLKLLAVARAAITAQKNYLREAGDWYDADLDDALAELAEHGEKP